MSRLHAFLDHIEQISPGPSELPEGLKDGLLPWQRDLIERVERERPRLWRSRGAERRHADSLWLAWLFVHGYQLELDGNTVRATNDRGDEKLIVSASASHARRVWERAEQLLVG